MKVAIIGFGIEGKSALSYWLEQGADVTVCDQNPSLDIPEGVKRQLGMDYLLNLDRFDVIVRTVGMHPRVILEKNPGVHAKITTNINEFLRVCPTKNVIGVTGTKGKGTTSTLIVKMLEAAGKQVFLGGNFGIPAFTFLPQLTEDSWVVLELSSFMLYDVKYSPHIAVCVMVVPEHLDWHDDVEDYIESKANLFRFQNQHDTAIYFADNPTSHRIASASPGRKISYYAEPGAYVKDGDIMIDETVLCKTSDIKLLGEHNWQNACAAATVVWQIVHVPDAIHQVLTTFTGLEHRLEFVREVDGVKYYDDSFGTTPETAEVAIKAFTQPKVLILGGSTKNSNYSQLAQTIAENNIRKVILIGNPSHPVHHSATPDVEAALKAQGVTTIQSLVKPGGATMTEIVAAAKAAAKPGDVVLLSAACASFDMFTDYKDRGNQFKAAVHKL